MILAAGFVRSRLVQRIYLVGLLQFAVVVGGAIALVRTAQIPPMRADTVRFLADELSARSENLDELSASVHRIYADMHWAVALYAADGHLLASAGPAIDRAATSDQPEIAGDRPAVGSVPLALRGRATGRLDYTAPRLPEPPIALGTVSLLILVVVGVSSWVTARSLAIPLAHLVATADAFGAGDLGARAALRRSDELGEVASAFDHMADRMTSAIRTERELLANISHELRTPLQRIRLALDIAAEGGAETASDSLTEISEDLVELEALVNDVLSTARLSLQERGPTSAVPPLRHEPIEARGLLEKAASRFRGAHPARHLDASIDGEAGLSGDPVMLRRAIDNLLENAHKYSDDPTTSVRLRSRLAQDMVVIEVEDEGIGITADDLRRVTEPFFRVDRSRTRTTGGVGLGLALAKRIVLAHGGRLSLESVPNQGTRARVELPLASGRQG